MSRQKLPNKDPEEDILVTFDFTGYLATGETVSNPLVTCETLYGGTDANPMAMVSGPASTTTLSPRVTQVIVGGNAGVNYRLQCLVDTSLGQKLVLAASLPVREA